MARSRAFERGETEEALARWKAVGDPSERLLADGRIDLGLVAPRTFREEAKVAKRAFVPSKGEQRRTARHSATVELVSKTPVVVGRSVTVRGRRIGSSW